MEIEVIELSKHGMKNWSIIVGFVLILVLYHVVGSIWGTRARVWFLIGAVALYFGCSLIIFLARRRVRAGVEGMGEEQRSELLRQHPGVAEELAVVPGVAWYWRALDALFGLLLAFGPPLIVTFLQGQPLSWDSEFTGYHLLAMTGGVAVYYVGRTLINRRCGRG